MEEKDEHCRLDSESVYEAESDEHSSQIVLETPDLVIVKEISEYFEASINGQKHMLSHPVTDHESSADSDSADSLFITQAPVSLAVRSVRRDHSSKTLDSSCSVESEEEAWAEDGPVPSQRKQQVSPAVKHPKRKAEKPGLKKYSFPFLERVYRGKRLSSRERAYRNTHLPLRKSVTFARSAIGGFFRCIKTLKKFSKGKATLALGLPKRHLDDEGELSPLSEQEKECDNSDDDIRVVDNCLFTPFLKKTNRQPWHNPFPEASKASSFKIQELCKGKTHLPSVKQTPLWEDKTPKQSFSLQNKSQKDNISKKRINPKSGSRVMRDSSHRSHNETDAEEPEIDVADSIDGQEENANRDISLTDWDTVTSIELFSEESEDEDISRKHLAVETRSPNNEVQESDHQNQTREREAEPEFRGLHLSLTEQAITNIAVRAEGQKKKQKAKKKFRGSENDQSMDETVGQPPCLEVQKDQDLVSSAGTDAILGGQASEISQDNISHSVSGEVIMPQKKKRNKESRRESHRNDEEMVTRQDQNAKLLSRGEGAAIVLRDDKQLKKKKKKKKDKNSIAHDTSENEHLDKLNSESHVDEAIGIQKERHFSVPPIYDETNLQVNTEICQKTIESSIVQYAELIDQKKHKTISDMEGSLAQINSAVSLLKIKKRKKERNSFCSNETAGNYSEMTPLSASILYPFDEISELKKMRKHEENQNLHTPKQKTERSEDMITRKKKKKKKKKKRKYSLDNDTVVVLQEDKTEQHHDTLQSAVSDTTDTFPQRKKKSEDKDLTIPLNATENNQKDHTPSQSLVSETDEITSPRKSKTKRERSKNNCPINHVDTAAPLDKESIVLEEWEESVLTPVDIVSQRKSKKKSGTHVQPGDRLNHGVAQLPQRNKNPAQNPSLEGKTDNLDVMEVRLDEASAVISSNSKKRKTKRKTSDEAYPDNNSSAMLTEAI
ncbi:phoenix [Esox lucius]|uniref:phoenix n=1 Tax=Esox lucius TaxID=8010 RepID=UPI001476897D|nr:phoenix [Esox lucius]